MKKVFLISSALLFLLGCILIYQNITYNDKKLHVVICDVGQGDAIFIRTPSGSDILIDSGPDEKVLSCLGKHMPFWDKDIEIVILTHPHADHLIGLIDVIKRYKVIRFYTEQVGNTTAVYKELIKSLAEHNIKEQFLWQGDKFSFAGGLSFQTLWPTHEWIDQNSASEGNLDINGFSVIELLTYKNFKALFTGDAEASTIEKIDLMAGKIDLLKVPHHGSKTGLDTEVLDVLKPKLAVISVGKKNRYGHPAPFTLDLLKQFGIKTLRTDQNGEVEIISDGVSFSIN